MRPRKRGVLAYPLDAVLGREVNVRVLRELARHGGQLTAAVLALRTGATKAGVIASLHELEGLRVTEVAGGGQARVHALSRSHSLSKAIELLFEAEEERLSGIHAAVVRSARDALGEPVAVWIYGSVARGEDGPASDLDIAVVARDAPPAEAVDGLRDRLHEAGRALAFHPSVIVLDRGDVLRLAAENDPWWRTVSRDARTLAGRDPAEALSALKRRAQAGA